MAKTYSVNSLNMILLLLRKSVLPIMTIDFYRLMNIVIIIILIETYLPCYKKQNCFSFSREINEHLNHGDCVALMFPSCTR